MQFFLVSMQFLESMQISVVFMQFFLKSLQLQKIIVKEQVEQKFFWRNLASQEGRMCGVGPQATRRLIRASAQRHPALRGSLRGKEWNQRQKKSSDGIRHLSRVTALKANAPRSSEPRWRPEKAFQNT